MIIRNGGINAHENNFVEPNLELLEGYIKSILLPDTEVILMHTRYLLIHLLTHLLLTHSLRNSHYIDEHPQLSVAISSAQMMFNYGDESIPFVNSHLLFQELDEIGENLWKKLLSDTGNEKDISSIIASSSASNPSSDNKVRQRLLNWMDLPPTVNPYDSKRLVNTKIGIIPIFVVRYSLTLLFTRLLTYSLPNSVICIITIDFTAIIRWLIQQRKPNHYLINKILSVSTTSPESY